MEHEEKKAFGPRRRRKSAKKTREILITIKCEMMFYFLVFRIWLLMTNTCNQHFYPHGSFFALHSDICRLINGKEREEMNMKFALKTAIHSHHADPSRYNLENRKKEFFAHKVLSYE